MARSIADGSAFGPVKIDKQYAQTRLRNTTDKFHGYIGFCHRLCYQHIGQHPTGQFKEITQYLERKQDFAFRQILV